MTTLGNILPTFPSWTWTGLLLSLTGPQGGGFVEALGGFFKPGDPLNQPGQGLDQDPLPHARTMICITKTFRPSESQISLLAKGLSFIPTIDLHKGQESHLTQELKSYHRRVKLAAYFGNPENMKGPTRFTLPSEWSPPERELPPEIRVLVRKDNKTFTNVFSHTPEKLNITLEEVRALKALWQNKNIVIKPAEKRERFGDSGQGPIRLGSELSTGG